MIIITLLSILGSGAFVGFTAYTLRKQWRYALNSAEAQRSPSGSSNNLFSRNTSEQILAPTSPLIHLTQPNAPVQPLPLDELISDAIAADKRLKFYYTSKTGEKSVRTIKPRALKRFKGDLCVYGFCYLRNAERTFALDRMEEAKVEN